VLLPEDGSQLLKHVGENTMTLYSLYICKFLVLYY